MRQSAALEAAHDAGAAPGERTDRRPATPDTAARPVEDFETVLYHITHDLRAAARPMAIVPGWIREDLAESGIPLSGALEEHLITLEAHAARLERMLLDLRTYSRVGRMSDLPARLDLNAELDAVVEGLALPTGFQVTRRLEAETLIAPRNEFRLALNAVIGNAWKHHDRDRGRITVAATLVGDAIRLSVVDDGPGVERRYRERAFEMMTTLRPRDEVEGSGMGLSIARRVMTRLGGTIEIAEPLAQRGACVVMVLPQPDGGAPAGGVA